MDNSNTTCTTAGIDTSKAKLDIAVHAQPERWRVPNTPDGWRQLAGLFAKAGVARVGIEATGGYEQGVVKTLRAHGFPVIVLQPIQVKAFARFKLRRAKTDALDAEIIAACTAASDQPERHNDERLNDLAQNLTFAEQTAEDITRLKIRLEHIDQPRLRKMAEADIARLNLRRAAELARIEKSLRNHADLARRLDLVLSIPGIGQPTAITLIVRMPELGSITREEAAALAGLAPFDDASGTHDGQRHIAGGRARVRRALYTAALPAAFRWNPALAALYKRLEKNGKGHKRALIACARKLLIYANTVLARDTPWIEAPPVKI